MAFFNSRRNKAKEVIDVDVGNNSKAYSMAKVFGYMFLWLLITAAVALGLGALFNYLILNNENNETISIFLIGMLAVSSIGILVMTFVIQLSYLAKGKSVLVPAIIYSVLMGVMLSSLTIFIDWYLLGVTFAITSLLFGIMSLIAILSKDRLNGLAIAGSGLLMGAFMMSGFMLIIMLFFPDFYEPYYWIISLAILCGVVLTTIFDISRIKSLANQGALTENLSLWLSFSLYTDFIYIFIKILRIVIRFVASRSSN